MRRAGLFLTGCTVLAVLAAAVVLTDREGSSATARAAHTVRAADAAFGPITRSGDVQAAMQPALAPDAPPADFDPALIDSPAAREWRAFVAFQDTTIDYLRDADALSQRERRARGETLLAEVARHATDRRLLAIEALELQSALIDRIESDGATAARRKDALRTEAAGKARMARAQEAARTDAALATYRAAEAAALAESRGMPADERARYLQQRLVEARTAAFAGGTARADR